MAERGPLPGHDGVEEYSTTPLPAPAGEGSMLPSPVAVAGPVVLVLRPRKAKLVCFLLVSLAFTTIGLASRQAILLLGSAFFGLCAAAFATMLLPGAAYLSLDADGFTTCSLFRIRRTSWSGVGPFGPTQVGGQAMVGYDSAEQAIRRPRLAAVDTGLSGYNRALPDTYGLSAFDLAALMNEARRRALATDG